MVLYQPTEFYRTFDKLPLDKFIDCLLTSDLQYLVISGTPKLEDLAEAWSNIYYSYCDLNEDNQTVYLIQLQKEITLLSNIICECETTLYLLSFRHHEGLADILKTHGYYYSFDPANKEQYDNSLSAVDNRLSPLRLKLSNAKKEYEEYIASRANQSVNTDYFDKMLIRLGRFYRMLIRANEITVKEFVLMIRDYLEYIQAKQESLEPENI